MADIAVKAFTELENFHVLHGEDDLHIAFEQMLFYGLGGNAQSPVFRIAEGTGRDDGKGKGFKPHALGKPEGVAVTGAEKLILTHAAALPKGAVGMYYAAAGEIMAIGEGNLSWMKSGQAHAVLSEPRPGCKMYLPVSAAAAGIISVSGVYYGVNMKFCDVRADN